MKRLRMKKRFNEAGPHRVADDEDLDVPVTEEEEVLARFIEECIAEEFGIGCSCETHNPGEEMHLEIFIGEDEYDEDTDLNELCKDLEELVNQIGRQEKQDSGTEWGDASFSPQGDYIYGEVWPLEGEYAINPKGELADESSVNDYDTQDYGDENYGEPDEFDVKARELCEEWEELGTKTKNEYCESLWYVLGNWIGTDRVDEKTVKAMLWEAVGGYDDTDVYEVILKMVENGKNSTLARKKNK